MYVNKLTEVREGRVQCDVIEVSRNQDEGLMMLCL